MNSPLAESRNRAERFKKCLAAIWDWMTGKRSEIKKQNERELVDCLDRDNHQRQTLIEQHLDERRELQNQILSLRQRLEQDYQRLQDPARDCDTDDRSVTNEAAANVVSPEIGMRLSIPICSNVNQWLKQKSI